MSSSAAGAGSPSLKAFHSETCSQTPFGGLQSTKVRGNYGELREERRTMMVAEGKDVG